ncbi:PQQ-binding-like beta-propeller repeat protein [Hyalangium gracile]|uniref:PQQ-binding-like beta-propeller repeat protein n=1 Tax=Hyalangium gracile TaxID=394092 RepID=UPI001CCE89DD|nr:PQQ-binding-like beta-propeller repeat protein [Hyalangium gracile]
MLRKLLGVGVLLATLAGCTKLEGRECTSDANCGEGGACNIELGLCYSSDTEPPVDPSECSPLCPDYQVCTRRGCVARFDSLTIETPADNALLDAGPVQVVARLNVKEAYRADTRFPPELEFTAQQSGGSVAGAFANYGHDDAGTYTAVWTPPAVEANVTVRVEHREEDAGLADIAIVRVDAVPPTFNVSVPPAPTGVSDGGTTYADPDAGSLTNLWKRDQQVRVEIQTNEANLDTNSLRVSLRGTDGVATPSVSVTPVTQGCTAVFCGEALLNLWEPTFNTFRGSMALEVQGNDLAGNVGTTSPASPQVNVTRWKWAVSGLSGTIRTSPAIGERGSVYIGTSDGKVLALTPEGTKAWEVTPGGSVASLAVGASDGGVESVYVATNAMNNKAVLHALSSVGGGSRVRCPSGTAELDGPIQGAIAVAMTGTAPNRFESGVAVVNSGATTQIWAVRPDASGLSQCIPSSSTFAIPETIQDGSLVASGTNFFYPTAATASIVSYTFGGNALNWTASAGAHAVYGLALTGDSLIGSAAGSLPGQGGLYSVPVTGSLNATLLNGTGVGRVWSPIIGTGGTNLFYGQDTGSTQGDLKKYDLPGQTVTTPTIPNVGVLKYAPALGADGVLYTAPSSSSVVSAWSVNDFSARWSVVLGGAPISGSVGLDCARNVSGAVVPNMPGTLYVPSGGTLHAIIVDSPGLTRDAAAWPKYQHDARNTGNPATPMPNCQ